MWYLFCACPETQQTIPTIPVAPVLGKMSIGRCQMLSRVPEKNGSDFSVSSCIRSNERWQYQATESKPTGSHIVQN